MSRRASARVPCPATTAVAIIAAPAARADDNGADGVAIASVYTGQTSGRLLRRHDQPQLVAAGGTPSIC